MATKPTTIPEFAKNDVIDGTSGENNVVAPGTAQKNSGWNFKQKPPRQYFNWLARWTYKWIDYLDASINQELNTTSNVQFGSVNTGQGANELFGMDQGVKVADDVVFADIGTLVDISGTVTITGWTSYGNKFVSYKKMGKFATVFFYVTGVSNSLTTEFVLPSVIRPADSPYLAENRLALAQDNTVDCDAIVSAVYASTKLVFTKVLPSGVWTASGAKEIRGQISYPTAT